MKKILFILCLFTIVSCKKSDLSFTDITGTWEMVRRMGMGYNETFTTGQGNLLQFNAGNKYKVFANHLMINEGPYRILKKNSTSVNKNFDAIFFGEDGVMNSISVKADSLTISTAPNDANGNPIMDGELTLYIRQK